ncbi:MAG: hypothetical protein GY799_20390 [Desulfobulbaceae bacterium]|nr:hypothetical protein [Desulfobulbaceae bacterium]
MTLLILIFAALILLAGLIIIIKPETVFGFLLDNQAKLELQITAVVLRLGLGILLIVQAGFSKFPLIIEIFGWLSIVAAIVLTLIGRQIFNRFISWALSFSKPFGRVGGFLAGALGAFLFYAFV